MRVVAELTARQRQVLRYFYVHACATGAPPAVRELCAAFGWHSTNAATGHLDALVRKGYLVHESDVSHAYRLRGVRQVIAEGEAGDRLREAIA